MVHGRKVYHECLSVKSVKLTIDVTNPELDALEDVLTVWSLCPSHLRSSPGATESRVAAWQYGCPRCRRLLRVRVGKNLKLWTKLCTAYDQGN